VKCLKRNNVRIAPPQPKSFECHVCDDRSSRIFKLAFPLLQDASGLFNQRIRELNAMPKWFIILLGCLVLMPTGCGYTTRATNVPFNTIYIDKFTNNIIFTAESQRNVYLPLLEVEVRDAIIDRFQFDGNVRIAKPDQAEALLQGDLQSYQRDGLRYDDNDDVEEYRVRIVVNLELSDSATGQVLWRERGFSGEATYFLTGPNASSEESAVDEAIKDLSRRIVERTIENW
jgi:hypothetical protein